MRVLQIAWEYPPLVEGGLGRHVHALARSLATRGVAVDVLTRGSPGAERGDELVAVHRVALAPFSYDVAAFLRWVAAMNDALVQRAAELVADGGFDLVHSHDWLVADAARATARAAGLPWLVTVHATEHGRHAGRITQPPQSTIDAAERAMARDADHLLTCSAAMRDHVVDVLGAAPDAVTALRNGIELPILDDATRAQPTVLLAGRLVHEKGFDLALRALAPILAGRRELRVVLAGAGPAERELRGLARRLEIAERVTFAGWLADDALHARMRSARLCVVPSRYEPFGIVALEAMAHGCPCVVADVGGLGEIAGDGSALRVPGGDVDALRAAIVRVLDDDGLRDRLARRGRSRAAGYDWARVADDTLAVYRALVAAPRTARPAATQPSPAVASASGSGSGSASASASGSGSGSGSASTARS